MNLKIRLFNRNTPDDNAAAETDPTSYPQNLFDSPARTASVPSKDSIRGKIEELIQGMVLLKVEDESAWATTLEWTDTTSLGEHEAAACGISPIMVSLIHLD
jgi:hypothetical protein